MQGFNISAVNESGALKTTEDLAEELCSKFYLYMSDDGKSIDPKEYEQSKETFKAFAASILNNVKPDDPVFFIGMEELDMEDDDE